MATHWEKSEAAAKEGAHVAAVLYKVLYVDDFKDLDYRSDVARRTIEDLMAYKDQLKKPEDRKAVEEFCALRYGRHLTLAGYAIEISASISKEADDVSIE